MIGLAVAFTACSQKGDHKTAPVPSAPHHHHEDEHVELAVLMGHLQRFADKLHFSGANQNWQLASFYLEELEEAGEEIEKAKIMEDGKDVSALIGQMLLPQLKAVEKAVEEKSMTKFQETYQTMVKSCNDCHTATNHGFIRITVPTDPTYRNQDFKPAK
jgi:hypothetical protein